MARNLNITDDQFEELCRTGSPLLLKADGTEVVVQDAAAYRRMLEMLDEIDVARSAAICAERWKAMEDGADPGVSAEEFLASLRQQLHHAG